MTHTPTLSRQEAPPGNVCANCAGDCYFKSCPSGATALPGIFYGAVNAGGCNDHYFCLRRPEMYDS